MAKQKNRRRGKKNCEADEGGQRSYLDPPCEDPAGKLHVPVLYSEVLSFVVPKKGMFFLDGTLGMGGHAAGVLRKCRDAGVANPFLLGLDRDLDALQLASARLATFSPGVLTQHSCFADFEDAIVDIRKPHPDFTGFDFVLVDIGVSSLQIDTAERGFSFSTDGPLDMRMDTSKGQSAEWIVNKLPVASLKELIQKFGEEPMAGKIARAIDSARSQRKISTTRELAQIVADAYPAKWRATSRNHPATRTFQALRIAVNDELGQLAGFLEKVVPWLRPGGKIAVITFHSLEDRIVKHFFKDQAMGCKCPKHIPVCICHNTPKLRILTKKALCASDAEIAANPRASSAKLRVAEKV